MTNYDDKGNIESFKDIFISAFVTLWTFSKHYLIICFTEDNKNGEACTKVTNVG